MIPILLFKLACYKHQRVIRLVLFSLIEPPSLGERSIAEMDWTPCKHYISKTRPQSFCSHKRSEYSSCFLNKNNRFSTFLINLNATANLRVLSRVPGSRKTFPCDAKYNPIYLSYIVGVNIVKRIAMLSLLVVYYHQVFRYAWGKRDSEMIAIQSGVNRNTFPRNHCWLFARMWLCHLFPTKWKCKNMKMTKTRMALHDYCDFCYGCVDQRTDKGTWGCHPVACTVRFQRQK